MMKEKTLREGDDRLWASDASPIACLFQTSDVSA